MTEHKLSAEDDLRGLRPGARFGSSLASLGAGHLAVGAPGVRPAGVVWLLRLDAHGRVAARTEIVETTWSHRGGLPPSVGAAVASLGDLDGDGVGDLIVGAPGDDWTGRDSGSARIWLLEADGVKRRRVIAEGRSGFGERLGDGARFGSDVGFLGDVDGDGVGDAVVGAGGAGAVFVLFLERDGAVRSHVRIAEGEAGFSGLLDGGDAFGHGCGGIGDLDGDGVPDLAVGAPGDDEGGEGAGAVWILFLGADGRVRSHAKVVPVRGEFGDDPVAPEGFGADVVGLGDLDGDGVTELGVSTFADDDGGSDRGSFWIVHPRVNGTVRATRKVSALQGGFGGVLRDGDAFGLGLARLDDLDGDGTPELAVGASGTDDGGPLAGAVWILFLDGPALGSAATFRPDEHNPTSYFAWGDHAGNPVMGGTVTLSVDVASTGHDFGVVLGVLGRTMEILAGGQALLIEVFHSQGEILGLPLLPAPVRYAFTVPADPALCGLTLSTQAVHLLGARPFALSNAIDLTVCR